MKQNNSIHLHKFCAFFFSFFLINCLFLERQTLLRAIVFFSSKYLVHNIFQRYYCNNYQFAGIIRRNNYWSYFILFLLLAFGYYVLHRIPVSHHFILSFSHTISVSISLPVFRASIDVYFLCIMIFSLHLAFDSNSRRSSGITVRFSLTYLFWTNKKNTHKTSTNYCH